jgi:hypothetical protein
MAPNYRCLDGHNTVTQRVESSQRENKDPKSIGGLERLWGLLTIRQVMNSLVETDSFVFLADRVVP